MDSLIKKYLIVITGVFLVFTQFVACGAELYQVSVAEDVDAHAISAESADPSSPEYGLHAPNGWEELPVKFKVGHYLSENQKQGLIKAMATWEKAVGKTLFEYQGVDDVDGDSFKDLYSSLNDVINGHYLDNIWGKTKKNPLILATTIWENPANDTKKILTADIRFNSEHYVIGDSIVAENDGRRLVVDMETLALHELGHLLGLTHIDAEVDQESTMAAKLYIGHGLHNRIISKGDIERVQKIYGCEGVACNIEQNYELMLSHESMRFEKEETHSD